MRWKQFFTPIQSITADEAKQFMENKPSESYTLLDVRQPNEYEAGHIPGAALVPLPDLGDRLNEIDPGKPLVVYCALGGRSRAAAQMLAEKGFDSIHDLTGGFKAWSGHRAVGPIDQGMALFTGRESLEDILVVAYSLEAGLRDFYLSMMEKVTNESVKDLFKKLSKIEVKHQDRIIDEYERISGKKMTREEFEKTRVSSAVEGGLTTEEYVNLYQPDWESAQDIVGLAMAIEAQALDLYQRASENSADPESKSALARIADEERAHLKQLGNLMENI